MNLLKQIKTLLIPLNEVLTKKELKEILPKLVLGIEIEITHMPQKYQVETYLSAINAGIFPSNVSEEDKELILYLKESFPNIKAFGRYHQGKGYHGWRIEPDSSIGSYGIEVISPPLPYDRFIKEVNQIAGTFYSLKYTGVDIADFRQATGSHINISLNTDESITQILKTRYETYAEKYSDLMSFLLVFGSDRTLSLISDPDRQYGSYSGSLLKYIKPGSGWNFDTNNAWDVNQLTLDTLISRENQVFDISDFVENVFYTGSHSTSMLFKHTDIVTDDNVQKTVTWVELRGLGGRKGFTSLISNKALSSVISLAVEQLFHPANENPSKQEMYRLMSSFLRGYTERIGTRVVIGDENKVIKKVPLSINDFIRLYKNNKIEVVSLNSVKDLSIDQIIRVGKVAESKGRLKEFFEEVYEVFYQFRNRFTSFTFSKDDVLKMYKKFGLSYIHDFFLNKAIKIPEYLIEVILEDPKFLKELVSNPSVLTVFKDRGYNFGDDFFWKLYNQNPEILFYYPMELTVESQKKLLAKDYKNIYLIKIPDEDLVFRFDKQYELNFANLSSLIAFSDDLYNSVINYRIEKGISIYEVLKLLSTNEERFLQLTARIFEDELLFKKTYQVDHRMLDFFPIYFYDEDNLCKFSTDFLLEIIKEKPSIVLYIENPTMEEFKLALDEGLSAQYIVDYFVSNDEYENLKELVFNYIDVMEALTFYSVYLNRVFEDLARMDFDQYKEIMGQLNKNLITRCFNLLNDDYITKLSMDKFKYLLDRFSDAYEEYSQLTRNKFLTDAQIEYLIKEHNNLEKITSLAFSFLFTKQQLKRLYKKYDLGIFLHVIIDSDMFFSVSKKVKDYLQEEVVDFFESIPEEDLEHFFNKDTKDFWFELCLDIGTDKQREFLYRYLKNALNKFKIMKDQVSNLINFLINRGIGFNVMKELIEHNLLRYGSVDAIRKGMLSLNPLLDEEFTQNLLKSKDLKSYALFMISKSLFINNNANISKYMNVLKEFNTNNPFNLGEIRKFFETIKEVFSGDRDEIIVIRELMTEKVFSQNQLEKVIKTFFKLNTPVYFFFEQQYTGMIKSLYDFYMNRYFSKVNNDLEAISNYSMNAIASFIAVNGDILFQKSHFINELYFYISYKINNNSVGYFVIRSNMEKQLVDYFRFIPVDDFVNSGVMEHHPWLLYKFGYVPASKEAIDKFIDYAIAEVDAVNLDPKGINKIIGVLVNNKYGLSLDLFKKLIEFDGFTIPIKRNIYSLLEVTEIIPSVEDLYQMIKFDNYLCLYQIKDALVDLTAKNSSKWRPVMSELMDYLQKVDRAAFNIFKRSVQ